MYEPVTNLTKAGDIAPDVIFTKVLNVPGSSKWSPENLTGRLTVVATFSDTSNNLYPVTWWNTLIDEFAGEPVQFIWMTGEEESTLLPWLSRHPVKGWVFYDPSDETRKAYGMEFPEYVIIGTDRRIMGFANTLTATMLKAFLEGRITRWASRQGKSSRASNLVFLQAEPSRWPPVDPTPSFPPSYTLHVSPSRTGGYLHSLGPDYLNISGYDLRDAIHYLYGGEMTRIDLPASLDDGKLYDFALCLPAKESEETMRDRFRQGIEDYFNITAWHESRLLDAYIVTATDRQPPRRKVQGPDKFGFFNRTSSMGLCIVPERDGQLAPLSFDSICTMGFRGTLDEFCQMLEAKLDRPVVNETNLQGEFKFEVESGEGIANDFLERLRDQTGLLITAAQRNVELVVVRPR